MPSKKAENYKKKEWASVAGCLFFCLALPILASGCAGRISGKSGYVLSPDSVMQLHYAKGFEVAYCGECKRVTVYDSWSSEHVPLQRYYLYDALPDSVLPTHPDGISLRIPLSSIALGSCTEVEFFNELSLLDKVKGMCNGSQVYNPVLRKGIAEGKVCDLGDSFNLDIEKTLFLGVDAFMTASYGKADSKMEQISRSGIPVLYNNEWMEADLLGRAEWIRFVAAFFDKEREADSLFAYTVARYTELKQLALVDSSASAISILSGESFRGTWYMPGGRSYTAQLFRDAGASYLFDSDTTIGSLSLSVEQVLRDFHSANVWVGVSASDLQEMAAKDSHYKVFEAWKRGEVYSYDLRSTGAGGNDYWESAVAHPDALLSDFVKLCHPSLLVDTEWNYLRKLSPCVVR